MTCASFSGSGRCARGTARRRPATGTAFRAGLLLLAAALAGGGCRRDAPRAAGAAAPRVEDLSHGPVRIVFTFAPPTVKLTEDVLLTIKTTAPADLEVVLPPLEDRLSGFMLSGSFGGEPITAGGQTVSERHVRLTPVIADEYRIAPLAVRFTDRSRTPAQAGWFATRPITLDPSAVYDQNPGKDIVNRLEPVWIRPPLTTVLLYIAAAVAAAGLVALGIFVVRRTRETIQLARMSPRERALRELTALLAKDLIGREQVKEFYLELTLIVRRYIERRHAIRAPEQTTEEFLTAVSRDPRFRPEVVRKLRDFLQAADLVKFAQYRPDRQNVTLATDTARSYVETDAEEAPASGDGKAA